MYIILTFYKRCSLKKRTIFTFKIYKKKISEVQQWIQSQKQWCIQGVCIVLDKVRTIAVKTYVFFDSGAEFLQILTNPSIIYTAWQPPSPIAPHHLHLRFPPPFTLAPCQFPSAYPSVMRWEEFYSCCQRIVHANTQRPKHISTSIHAWTDSH